jgi:Tol biopolymer transport system component
MLHASNRNGGSCAARLTLATLIALGAGACGEESTAPVEPVPLPTIPQLLVSNPVAAGADQVAYVSITAGASLNGSTATITNRRTGSATTQALVAGALDPVALRAVVGDTIAVAVDTGGTQAVTLAKVVPASQPLMVVRTEPGSGKTNVPLDARVTIVFSEPLDASSLTGETAVLEQAGSPVSRTVEVSSDGLRAAFTPSADLLPTRDYRVVLATAIRGSDGGGLASAFTIDFRTATVELPPPPDPPPVKGAFPPVPRGAVAYLRVIRPGDASGSLSRYLLHEDSTFALQYLTTRFGFFEYPGRYSRTGASIALQFDANAGQWQATGTLEEDSLVVAYNLMMRLDDFEDGVYRVVPATNVLAFSRGGDLYVINADGTGLRQLTTGLGEDWEAAWSPDGSRIAFTRYREELGNPRWGEATIYVVNADGTGLLRLSSRGDSVYDAHPSWSPDGTRIAFYSRREHDADPSHMNDSDIYVMHADGTGAVRLTHHGALVIHPAWSPDGSRIAFRAWNPDAQAFAIYAMGADGSSLTPIVNGESAYAPAWSPDGSRILTRTVRCVTEVEPHCIEWDGPHLTTVDPDGSSPARLSDHVLHGDDLRSTPASWSPDGDLIAFTQIGCSWPNAEWTCRFPSSIEILRLSDGQVTRLVEGSSPSWRR